MMADVETLTAFLTPTRVRWAAFIVVNALIAGFFAASLTARPSPIKAALLPGETTHGHYQIELACSACHDASSAASASADDVMNDACVRCHGEQLRDADDTHPARKFNDPVHADLLATLDAQSCLSCHAEHVPERTTAMGLTMPVDYCWHCHQDVGDSRPSHVGMTHDTCATAGCHNYHDNRALYEKFLDNHYGQPDLLAEFTRLELTSVAPPAAPPAAAHPAGLDIAPEILSDWSADAHAAAGVNCGGCHGGDDVDQPWTDSVSLETCGGCHQRQSGSFVQGRHGMRLSPDLGVELSPMTPAMARLPMHADAAHRELTCNACHSGHRFDTAFAAADACLQCHADDHSLAWRDTAHAGSDVGVTCATCHMPRTESDDGTVWVNHNQNTTLRPNETMARQVCLDCHGLEFSLSSLADVDAARSCYAAAPDHRIESVQMAHNWFEARRAKRDARKRSRRRAKTTTAL